MTGRDKETEIDRVRKRDRDRYKELHSKRDKQTNRGERESA